MSKAICNKYPQLKDVNQTNGEYWSTVKEYISQRFRNLRRNSHPLQTDKGDGNNSKSVVTVATMSKPDDESDDEIAYKRNSEALTNEFKKKNNNHSIILKLLKLTYIKRRQDMCESAEAITKLLDKYIFFSNKTWIFTEFKLMTNENILSEFTDNWFKFVPLILGSSEL
jgi:hypothetical protein